MDKRLKYKQETVYGQPRTIYGPKTVIYLYSVSQSAEFCKVSEDTIRRWKDIGLLTGYKECINEEVPASEANKGKLFFLKEDLLNALRVIHAQVPVEKFSV